MEKILRQQIHANILNDYIGYTSMYKWMQDYASGNAKDGERYYDYVSEGARQLDIIIYEGEPNKVIINIEITPLWKKGKARS
jgi:hypothetical protein